jgi:polyisoprenoid-binding protein YceI
MSKQLLKKRVLSTGIALATLALVQASYMAGWAKPLHFEVSNENPANKIAFTSDAPVEVINGHTNDLQGTIQLDDSFTFDAKHPFKIEFSVNLASIDTGIPLRNEHMRDNFLETKQFPKAVFKATSIQMKKKPDLAHPQTIQLVSKGNFTLHGVTTQKTIPLTVHYTPATEKQKASVKVTGKFPVNLEQYKIKRPEAVFVKLAETVIVTVNTTGKSL